jgi:hypothetical protein
MNAFDTLNAVAVSSIDSTTKQIPGSVAGSSRCLKLTVIRDKRSCSGDNQKAANLLINDDDEW